MEPEIIEYPPEEIERRIAECRRHLAHCHDAECHEKTALNDLLFLLGRDEEMLTRPCGCLY